MNSKQPFKSMVRTKLAGRSASAAIIKMPGSACHSVSLFTPSAIALEAEYMGLIIGLEKAQELGISKLEIKGDCQTIVHQVLGKYLLASDSRWLSYRARVINLLSFFDDFSLAWITRKQNQLAHRATNKCLKTIFISVNFI